MAENKTSEDMIEVPKQEVAELARWRGMECGDLRDPLSDDVDTKAWKLLRDATVSNIGRTRGGEIEVFFETPVTRARRVARSTQQHPAEYQSEEHVVIIRVEMKLGDPEAGVAVDVEMERI